jgi:coenzyme PQQ synthesis protein D (PqqD)
MAKSQQVDRSATVGLPRTVSPRDYVVSATHGADMALLDPVEGQYFTLNTVGARVWQLLCINTTPQGIVEALEREFDGPRAEIEIDLARLLNALSTARLVDVE